MKFIQAIDAERQSYQPECWPSKSVTTSQTMQHVVSTFQKNIIDVDAARPVNQPRGRVVDPTSRHRESRCLIYKTQDPQVDTRAILIYTYKLKGLSSSA
jgi:hypothetical protein